MVGIYLSGTGNTKYCVKLLSELLEPECETVSLGDKMALEKIKSNDVILFGYPVHFSDVPYMAEDFINSNASLWKDKKIICLATADNEEENGAFYGIKLLKEHGSQILGGINIKMPNCVCDIKYKEETEEEKENTINKATEKIKLTAEKIKCGIYPHNELLPVSHKENVFWKNFKTYGYTDKVKIKGICVDCGICVDICPMKNIYFKNGSVRAGKNCTMCYGCVNSCPKKAITVLGENVYEQYGIEKYLKNF